MSKEEFLDTLRKVLARELSESEVADNINYYWNYIEQQIASGKTEEQVLQELGDPRLVQRTILQVDEKRERSRIRTRPSIQKRMVRIGKIHRSRNIRTRLPVHTSRCAAMTAGDWAKIVQVIVIICIVLGMVFHILWKLLPVLLVIAALLWIYRKFTPEIKYAGLAGCEIYWKMLY